MSIPKLCAAFALVGALAVTAHAQLPPAAPKSPKAPKVITWPGGYLVMNGPEVVVKNSVPGGSSTNIVTGSGNGFGNTIVVDGGAGGLTVVKNARIGIGNKLVLNADDLLLDLDMPGVLRLTTPAAAPAPREKK